MNIAEKVSYLRGLCDGLGLDENNKQDKILKSIVDVLDEVAFAVGELDDSLEELSDQIDAVDEDLANLEEEVYEDDDDDDYHFSSADDDDEDFYEVECPACGDTIYLDEEMIEDGSIDCPNCGTELEFDFSEEESSADEKQEEKHEE